MALLRNPLVYVWLFLVAATLLSWWASQVSASITASVLLLSFVKVRLVIRHFMEVRFAPRWLRVSCDAWLVLVIGLVFGLSWSSL